MLRLEKAGQRIGPSIVKYITQKEMPCLLPSEANDAQALPVNRIRLVFE
jgi:hypothetical protein